MDVGILVYTNGPNSGSYSNVVGWSSSLLDVGHTWGESSGKKADAITPGDREIPPRGHRCLDLETISRQALGGPTNSGGDSKCRRSTRTLF